VYSNGSHIANDLENKNDADFDSGYKNIIVINPNAEKHFETVVDTNYASMLRKFTLELEKENSVLIIIGFSLADKHIKNLLYGVMKNNPTLVVIYFSYSQYDEFADKYEEKKNPSLYVISSEVKKDKFNKFFNNDSDWNKFVKDPESKKLELVENIKEVIEGLDEGEKKKILNVLSQPFEETIDYLEKVFSNQEEAKEDIEQHEEETL
jgi:hypothetical protein